ncbi:L,D-transpeptidase Cds6 family protein [Pseudoduganella sp. OTU4001]|uniref:L,D-transpeptidase Cds6 family protein n=1 Tax=Pseudoduganella sp. OTU4001 TaxID=3043854 RepID=UPI00313CAE49
MRGGQLGAALAKVDVALSQRPKDAQLRFLKGMILSEQGKTADAINVFQKLTEDYPELPEPYNNLAVLHAAAGNYDKARVSLERAIRTNPTYATAHENLGDVYAKLASQSYDKAMQLLDTNQPAPPKSKLAMVRTLTPKGGNGAAPVAVAAAPAQAAPAPAPAVAQAAPQPAKVAPPVTAPAQAPAKPAAPAVQLAKTEPKPEPKAEPPKKAEKEIKADDAADDVSKAVSAWAKAWSSQDMKGYLNAYGSNFQTPKGQNRKAWEADRTNRIQGKDHIKVTIESPQITVNGNTATVKFRQKYVSDRLSTTSRKTLVLEKQGKNWLIKQEQSGS